MLVADSSVWIDFFNGAGNAASDALEGWLIQGDAEVLMPDLVLFEIVRGFRTDREMRDAMRILAPMGARAIGGEAAALRAAERYRSLRAVGYTVRSGVDALLASYCIDHDHILLHRDRDFLPYVERFGLRAWPLTA
ncbi:MAG: PIN domain-containing protein [Roseateles sp.]|uniref:type II toxin-antitoxin system VapC family toxin n=1 Tax=Roseateles sp. TaxID=1971397 RepID=UPI0039ECA6E9